MLGWLWRILVGRFGEDQGPVKTMESQINARRSMVRVAVTYGAGLYIVSGGLLLIAMALFDGETMTTADGVTKTTSAMFQEAKDVYLATLAVATTIVTYWFADRGATKKDKTPPSEETTPGSESKALLQQEEQTPETTPDPLANRSSSSPSSDSAAPAAAPSVPPDDIASDKDK